MTHTIEQAQTGTTYDLAALEPLRQFTIQLSNQELALVIDALAHARDNVKTSRDFASFSAIFDKMVASGQKSRDDEKDVAHFCFGSVLTAIKMRAGLLR